MWYENYFEIVKKLSQTQMSQVFLARDRANGELGVLKIVNGVDPHINKRLIKEARILKKINHPGIAKLKKFVEDKEGIGLFIEYIDGENLRELITGSISFKDAVKIVTQLLDILGYIHSKGIVHRDIKPSNILIRHSDNSVVVIDFGISYFKDWERITYGFIGTPYYSSPEQIAGEKAKPSMDIYSVGATLYALLTGNPPFLTSLSEAIAMKLEGYPSLTPVTQLRDDVPKEIDTVLAKALHPDPSQRYKTCDQFKRDLENLLRYGKLTGVKNKKTQPFVWSRFLKTFAKLPLSIKRDTHEIYFEVILWHNGKEKIYRLCKALDRLFFLYDPEYDEIWETDGEDWNIALGLDLNKFKPFIYTRIFSNESTYLKNKKWHTIIPEKIYVMILKKKEVKR